MRRREIITQSAKPGDIPFFLASRFEHIINLKTAKVVSRRWLRADQVID